MAQPTITVYVPCYNAEPWLDRVLVGVLEQTLRPAEVIVVDDGSRDRTVEIASRYPVTVVRQDGNDLVAALDADVVPESGWLAGLAPHFEDAKTALAGGKLVEAVEHGVADRWRAVHLCQHWGDAAVENPGFVFGANTMARRSAVLEAGGYDERLRTNGEDSDLSRRLRERGWTTFYEPAAVCRHLREDTVGSALTTFWRYRRDFLNPMTPEKIWRAFRYQHIGSARSVMQADLRDRRYELLGMDALLLVASSWNDLRLWRSRPAPRDAAHAGAPPSEATP
jgi:cellulose synthase/poly-beta-1,6-N-acetylglucosamine synthase-like glycosyltransferase